MASILDRTSNCPLLFGIDSGNATRENFPLIVQKTLQELDVAIVNILDILNWIPLLATARITLPWTEQSVILFVASTITVIIACHVTSSFYV